MSEDYGLAGRLRSELQRRDVHPEALAYGREELLRESASTPCSRGSPGALWARSAVVMSTAASPTSSRLRRRFEHKTGDVAEDAVVGDQRDPKT